MALNPESKTAKLLSRFGIIPRYTEISMFLTTFTIILLLLFNKVFLNYFISDIYSDPRIAIILSIFAIVSIYLPFSKETPLKFIALLMALSMIIINLYVALYAFNFLNQLNGPFIWRIFPSLNLINAFMLLILLRVKAIDEKNLVSEKQTKLHEVIIGSIAIVFIFVLSQFIFKNNWVITFSICLTYAGLANEFLTQRFFQNNKN